MSRLFFVAASLEPLHIDSKPSISFDELLVLLETNLPKNMIEDLKKIRLMGDIINLQAHFYGREVDRLGVFHQDELQDLLSIEDKLPDFVIDFIHKYSSNEERRKFFPALVTRFFHEQIAASKGFLHELFLFLFQTRLVIAFLRAKKRNLNVSEVFSFEDPKDPFIAFLLAQKQSDSVLVEEKFNPLKAMIESSSNPLEMRKGYYQFLIYGIQNMVQKEPYSKEYIYSYFLNFVMIDRLRREMSGNGEQFMAV